MDKRSCEEMLISVVMPAFNAEKTIGQAIRSVLEQTYQNLELLIIEDGSADRTLSVAEAYAEKDKRVRILPNGGNRGVSYSRNRGVKEAKAEWVAFLDSDDLWEREKLEKQIAAILSEPACPLFYTGSAFVNEQGDGYAYLLHVPERLTYRELLKQNLISCSSVVVKKAALEKHPMRQDPMIHEDFATWLGILKDGTCAVGIDEPLLIYRLSSKSKSGKKLRAARMQWLTYRAVGIGRMKAFPYFMIYAWRNVRKYTKILQSADRKDT